MEESKGSRVRNDGRAAHLLRPVTFELDYVAYPAGSVLVSFGSTRVLCNASVEERVPGWLEGRGLGWVTAEYSMLPAATHSRGRRESGHPSARSQEIQRLIGRALRASLDRTRLGPRTIVLDCDVLQADGGTRTASITGAYVALALACFRLQAQGLVSEFPLVRQVAAVSVGLLADQVLLDLDYSEDSVAEVDANLVATAAGDLVELQATGEQGLLPRRCLETMIDLGLAGVGALCVRQREALAGAGYTLSLTS